MLTLLGFGMVIAFMTLIMTRRALPLVALIIVPIVFGFLAGFGPDELGRMMIDGLRKIAPTGVMLMFAILYFGVMIDAGLFDPLVQRVVAAARGDPQRVLIGTALLASIVSLDGDGSTTYMITCAAMLPLYRRLGMDALGLTCVTMLANGVMNLTPWAGPLARAATALQVDPAEVFIPMIPVMGVGAAGVFALAWILGRRERARLGVVVWPSGTDATARPVDAAVDGQDLRRPRLRVFNAILTFALLAALVAGALPLPVLFMIALSLALVVNYPRLADQRARIAFHAPNVLAVVSVIFAAGVFAGILEGTGMIGSMSGSFLALLPAELGPYMAPITALASLPFTFFISNDAFYFGVLPILADAAEAYAITPVEIARASLIGQPLHLLSPLVPSTYLLVGLAGVDFGDHQRYTVKWAVTICLLMLLGALLLGTFPLVR
jgi:CitMHS family citrate-Mg2+:H+ or citrate-Ca2+:H+ symporter